MRKHTLNLYRLNNIAELDFSFRLVEFDLHYTEGKEDMFNKQMQKIAQKISSITGGPSAIIKRLQRNYIAIPANRSLPETKVDVVPFSVTVRMLPGIYTVSTTTLDKTNLDVIQSFLEFEIRRQLSNSKSLWKLNTNQFFFKQPIVSNEESDIEIYGGFIYKLVYMGDGNFYVCLDLATKYIDKYYLSHYINADNVKLLSPRFRGRRTLYQNGDDWYTAEIEGFGRSIAQHEFTSNGQTHTVKDYIENKTSNHYFQIRALLKPDDLTLLYTYPGRSMEQHSGASSLARIVYGPNDTEVKALHRYSIKDPSRRFETIGKNISSFFQTLQFNRKKLLISGSPLTEQVRIFPMPVLKYNNDRSLKVGHYSTGANASLRDLGTERKNYIVDNGILDKSSFDEQYLIVPEHLDKELVEAFKKNAEWQIRKLAPAFTGFKVLRYKIKEGQANTFMVQEIEKMLRQQNALSGFALFILPDDKGQDSRRQAKTFHDCLKSKFYPALKVQCASAFKIKTFFRSFSTSASAKAPYEYKVPEDKKPMFKSYLFNLVMEHLIVNRKWPYALKDNLHYDIYIGIDVHDRFAGVTFFFKNGEKIFFTSEPVPRKNWKQRAEKLKAPLLVKMIYEKLKIYIPKYAPNPNGIVIVRDGRSFGEEDKALMTIISSLSADSLLNTTSIMSAVVGLYKQSAVPLRLASQTDSYNNLENPVAGAFKLLGNAEGFIYNTGYPFQIRGSARPLHLSLKSGNAIFMKIMEDLFCQSMLAFSAPDRSNSLPVTIKLIDTLLEPLASTAEIEEDEYEAIVTEN